MKRYLLGTHAVEEALRASPKSIVLILTSDDSPRSPHRAVLALAASHGLTVERREAADLDTMAGKVRHQGLVAIAGGDYPYVEFDTLLVAHDRPLLLVALDEITDVHNLGAIVRSAVAMGAHGVLTLKDRAAPVNATVVRASAGATEHCKIARVTNLARTLETLVEREVQCVGLDASATQTLDALDLTLPTTLVIGSEGRGLRRLVRERCSTIARIPMGGTLGSLNASVAAGIALYETVRQRAP